MSTEAFSIQRVGILLPCAIAGFLLFYLVQPTLLLTGGAVVFVALFALALCRPEAGTLLVLFLLYSNLAVVAAQSSVSEAGATGPRTVALLLGLWLILGAALIHLLFLRRQRLIFDRGLGLMVVLLAAFLASSLLARDEQLMATRLLDYVIQGLALFFLLTNVIRDLALLRRATWVLLLAGGLMAGLSLYQAATHTQDTDYGGLAQLDSGPQYGEENQESVQRQRAAGRVGSGGEILGQARAAGPVGNANQYGQILLVLLPLAALQFRTASARKWRALALASAGLILGAVFLTFSRSSLLATIAVFFLMAFGGLLSRRHVLLSAVGVGLLVVCLQPTVVSRMLTLERVNGLISRTNYNDPNLDSSMVMRYALDVAAWHVFLDHLLLGVGPGQFSKYYSTDYVNRIGLIEMRKGYQAHNLYLQALAETGLLGATCLLSIMGAIMYGLWRERRRLLQTHPDLALAATGFLISLAGLAVVSIFNHLYDQRYFWLLMALSSAAIRILHSQSESGANQVLP